MHNFTHRFTSESWRTAYLLNENNPHVCYQEGREDYSFSNGRDGGWMGLWKDRESIKMEILNVSLENK